MAHHDESPDLTAGSGCCAVGCVVAMAGVLGGLLLAVWVIAPAIARLVAA